MNKQCLIMHVTRDHEFKNEYLFFRFTQDEPDHGHVEENESGESASWA